MGQWVVYLIRNAMEILKKLDEMDTSDVHITLYNWVFLVKILCPNFKLWKNVTELYVLMCKKAGDFCLQLSPKKVPLRWWFWTNRREWKKNTLFGSTRESFRPNKSRWKWQTCLKPPSHDAKNEISRDSPPPKCIIGKWVGLFPFCLLGGPSQFNS